MKKTTELATLGDLPNTIILEIEKIFSILNFQILYASLKTFLPIVKQAPALGSLFNTRWLKEFMINYAQNEKIVLK